MKKKSIRKSLSKLFLLISILLLCYPGIAEIYNAFHSSYVISDYQKAISEKNEEEYANILEQARKYNEALLNKEFSMLLSKEEMKEYLSILDVTGNGVMGSISIPKINVNLPIYHTTDDKYLQVATGHIPGTSFPIGGISTNAVISGHRGMASSKLFTDLPKLVEGDTFKIRVLNEILTYEIDQIKTVTPQEIDELKVVEGQDYCSLVTCTPIGINSHRIIVRGHRIETIENKIDDNSNIIKELIKGNILSFYEIIMFCIAIFLFSIGFVIPFIRNKKKKEGEKK